MSYSELFHGLVFDTIPSGPRVDWDNSSGDVIVTGISSMEACTAACAADTECLQLRFNGDECVLSTKVAKLGAEHNNKEQGEKRWQSSWNRTRIATWASKQGSCGQLAFPM